MRNHITPNIGQMRLTDVRAVDLDGLYSRLTHKGLGPARVRQAHTVLSSAFSQAVKWELVRYNPCVNATPPLSSSVGAPSTY
jgi:integrase